VDLHPQITAINSDTNSNSSNSHTQ